MASIESPRELFVHKLGDLLTAEETILEMLEELQEKASDAKLRRDLAQHHRETQQQVDNLHRAFQALGEPVESQPCPAIKGIKKEGEQLLKDVDDELVDSAILGGVIATEHYEIAGYDSLIIKAEAMGEEDVVALLLENLEQEEAALDKAVKATEQLAKVEAKQTV